MSGAALTIFLSYAITNSQYYPVALPVGIVLCAGVAIFGFFMFISGLVERRSLAKMQSLSISVGKGHTLRRKSVQHLFRVLAEEIMMLRVAKEILPRSRFFPRYKILQPNHNKGIEVPQPYELPSLVDTVGTTQKTGPPYEFQTVQIVRVADQPERAIPLEYARTVTNKRVPQVTDKLKHAWRRDVLDTIATMGILVLAGAFSFLITTSYLFRFGNQGKGAIALISILFLFAALVCTIQLLNLLGQAYKNIRDYRAATRQFLFAHVLVIIGLIAVLISSAIFFVSNLPQ